MRRFLSELDIHYLAITFLVSLVCIGSLGTVREPMAELAIGTTFSPIANAAIVLLSFVAIAPWGFTRTAIARCMNWVAANFIVGSILTFLLLSTRALYSVVCDFL